LGRQGVKSIVEYPLSPEELGLLRISMGTLREELAMMPQGDNAG
jgi:malate/lactate dehydrogenase